MVDLEEGRQGERGAIGKVMATVVSIWNAMGRIPSAHLSMGQGIYYILTGLWPFISIGTFIKYTGPKTDIWLVNTVGLLIFIIGCTLLVAGARRRATLEVMLLAVGSAFALAAIDVFYVYHGQISTIYLMDAVVEILIILSWISIKIHGIPHPEIESMPDSAYSRPEAGRGEDRSL